MTVLAFSVFATLLSPISFLTLVGNAYTGRSYLWFAQCGIFLAIPLAHRYFLPLYQKGNYETAYHLLEDRFPSPVIRSLASGLFILYQFGANSSGDLLVVSGFNALSPYQSADLVWFTPSLDGLLQGVVSWLFCGRTSFRAWSCWLYWPSFYQELPNLV